MKRKMSLFFSQPKPFAFVVGFALLAIPCFIQGYTSDSGWMWKLMGYACLCATILVLMHNFYFANYVDALHRKEPQYERAQQFKKRMGLVVRAAGIIFILAIILFVVRQDVLPH